jgi:predicted permease
VWPVDNEDYAVFEQFSYNPIDTIDTVKSDDLPRNINGVIDLRFRILLKKGKLMEEITKIFDIILFPLSILALSFWFILVFITLFRNSRKEHLDFLLISFFVLGAFLSRIGTLTIVDATTSIPGIFYSQSTQIFLTLFSILMLTWGINFLQKKIKNSNHIMSTIKENSI